MATPSLTKSFDASLVDLQRSFSSTDTNTTGSSAKENREVTETPTRDVRSLTNEHLYEQWAPDYDTDGNVLQAVDDIQSRMSIPEAIQSVQNDLRRTSSRPIYALDFGCGTGRTTQKLLQSPHWNQPAVVHGWDASEQMLTIARSKCIPPLRGPSKVINFRQVSFSDPKMLPREHLFQIDLLVSNLVLEHIPLNDYWNCIIALLRPGGIGFMSNMHPDMGSGSVAGFKEESGQRLVGKSYVHGVRETVDSARRAGLEVWDVKEVAVDEGMIERGEVGERGRKWIGRNIWMGMKFRKPVA